MSSGPTASLHRLSFWRLVLFALPSACIGALAVAVPVFLPQYYASHYKLGLAAVGSAFMAVRLIDTLFDPVIGLAMDRTRTRFGRYRLWIVASLPVLMIPVAMLFMPFTAVNIVYLVGWLFIYYIGASLISLPHLSWASVIAGAYHERSRVFGAIQVVGILAATTVLILPVAAKALNHGRPVDGMAIMGGFVVVAAALGVTLCAAFTPERIVSDHHAEALKPRDYWAMISRQDMRRIIIADFCLAMGPGWMAAVYLFYFRDARGFTTEQASLLLLIYIATGVLGATTLSGVARRLGKHRTQMMAAVGYSLGLIGMGALPKGHFLPVALFMCFMGFLASAFVLLDRAMVADVGDAVRLETGKHRVGLLYAMITTTQKIAAGLSIGFSFTVLQMIGYRPDEGAGNTAAAIHGMTLVYLIGPIVFVMLGAACYIGYGLDARRHGEIRVRLDARDAETAS